MKFSKKKKTALSLIITIFTLAAVVTGYIIYDGRQVSNASIDIVFNEFMPKPYEVSQGSGNSHIVFRESCAYYEATHDSKDANEAAHDYADLIKKLENAGWKIVNQDSTTNGRTLLRSKATKNSFTEPDMMAYINLVQDYKPSLEFRFVKNFKNDCL